MPLAPRQARSRRTREKLLDAAAGLVDEEGVEGATVAEIARRAGTSVGNVYRRFPSKAALLRTLEEEFLAGREEYWADLLDVERWRGAELASLVRSVVEEMVRRHRRHRGLLRAVALRARTEYEAHAPAPGEGPAERLAELILELWPGAVCHPEPRQAVGLAFEMAAATAGELVLFRDGGPGALGLDDEELTTELVRTVLAYLGADPGPHGGRP